MFTTRKVILMFLVAVAGYALMWGGIIYGAYRFGVYQGWLR